MASPPLVVAYALAGSMDIDLYKDSLGKDKNNQDVYLKDIWPSNKEIEDLILKSINAEMFKKRYENVSSGPKEWQKINIPASEIYSWDDNSTYVKKPPFFENLTEKPEDLNQLKMQDHF